MGVSRVAHASVGCHPDSLFSRPPVCGRMIFGMCLAGDQGGSDMPVRRLLGVIMLVLSLWNPCPVNGEPAGQRRKDSAMLEILRRNEVSGQETGSFSAPLGPTEPASAAATGTVSTGPAISEMGNDAGIGPGLEDRLFSLEFQADLVADFADHLGRSLVEARKRLGEVMASFPVVAIGELTATESLRPYLQIARRLARWTPGILGAMFARSIGPAEAHGVLAALGESAAPYHPLFEAADLRLTIELLQAKRSKTAELRKTLDEQVRSLKSRR